MKSSCCTLRGWTCGTQSTRTATTRRTQSSLSAGGLFPWVCAGAMQQYGSLCEICRACWRVESAAARRAGTNGVKQRRWDADMQQRHAAALQVRTVFGPAPNVIHAVKSISASPKKDFGPTRLITLVASDKRKIHAASRQEMLGWVMLLCATLLAARNARRAPQSQKLSHHGRTVSIHSDNSAP